MTNGELLKSNSAVIQQLFCFLSGGEVQLTEKLKNEVKTFNPLRSLIIVVLVIAAAYLVALTLVPAENLELEGGTLGLWSCVPAVFLVVYIFCNKARVGRTDIGLGCRPDIRGAIGECDRCIEYYCNGSHDG